MSNSRTVKKKEKSTGVILAIVAVILAVAVTLAWFVHDFGGQIYNSIFDISKFVTDADVYFNASGESLSLDNGLINADISNKDANNYLGKLHIDAKYKGLGYGYLRVRIIASQEYTSGGKTHISQLPSPLPVKLLNEATFKENEIDKNGWFDNTASDGYFYYTKPLSVANALFDTLPLIEGVDMNLLGGIVNDNGAIKLSVEVDAVQINRYKQVWGIDSLPWEQTVANSNS